jgi:SAM-dependent methyltransferase
MAVIEYLKTPDQALAEMKRVLKPGGIAIITMPKRWHVSRVTVAATKPVRLVAKLLGAATADHLPRLRLQPDELDQAARRVGLTPDGGSQYHFTPFAYPLTRVAPGLSMQLNMPFEKCREALLCPSGRMDLWGDIKSDGIKLILKIL